jgi:acyl-CoA thioesterase II
MGDLELDTAVEGADGRYTAVLSPDWEIWGPNGGYVASIALRAAAAASRFDRPASLSCHFLTSAAFDVVELRVEVLRSAKRAESLRVSVAQDDRTVLEALVWMVDEGEGLEHDNAPLPDVPGPDGLPSVEELLPDLGEPRFSFFHNLEERPTDWRGPWETREPGEPRVMSWYRFRPEATFADPVVDACRTVVLVDTFQWPAAAQAHRHPLAWIAPNLDLTVRFHRLDPSSEWLLCRAESPVATEGLVGGTASVWSANGLLLASGSEQMLCRPAPPMG